ncbi:MAG: chromosomal replication initiator protein DnaA [Anaerovoracaceae bacterium]|nr:chromosomal replication initiator protein DnaA [Anaerovoracaceae bacterium]
MRKNIEEKKWADILSEISNNVTEVSYRTWFEPLFPLELDEDAAVIYFASSNDFLIEVLRNRYISVFERAVESVYNKKYKVIIKNKSEEELQKAIKGEDNKEVYAKKENEEDFREEYFLNPRYNFDNFIVGANNNYAHAVALAVAESPAAVYNPLFIYGGSGLGKTHLMHAIGHYILENNPSLKVLYVSSEMFTSELIKALQDNKNKNSKVRAFKNKYRNVDILLIDDIQFIEGKDATQIEFFHTFNALYDYKKQIVISSDRHPSKLTDLDERLRSRFQWNIVADIQPPDFETRVAILRNKTEQEKVEIDDDVLEVIDLIAEKVKFNIRELESALTRIISYSKIFNKKITVKFARESLNDIFSTSDFNITCESIKKAVCKKYNIKISDMESAKRKREFSHPRQIAMYLCRELTDYSLPKIGESFGGRDHTTVLHAYDKISNEIKTNSLLAEEINALKSDIK